MENKKLRYNENRSCYGDAWFDDGHGNDFNVILIADQSVAQCEDEATGLGPDEAVMDAEGERVVIKVEGKDRDMDGNILDWPGLATTVLIGVMRREGIKACLVGAQS